MFAASVSRGVLRVRRPDSRWLVTDWAGGYRSADAAYNLTVPHGFDRTDLRPYVERRRERAGFPDPGPALLTGVDVAHARRARADPVEVVATVGLSNPATLPMAPEGEPSGETGYRPGTVNLLVGTTRALDDGGLATLLATAVEARTATLKATTGFTGTTSDGVVVATDPTGDPAAFAGSATSVGAATRACVRAAVRASLDARYPDGEYPRTVTEADHGVSTEREATVSPVE
ncbi:MAG: adenosylcobinamide amidohydrolase [Halorientalis sp.]